MARHAFTLAGMVATTLALVALLAATAFYARTWLVSDNMAAVISAVMVDLTNHEREKIGTLSVNPQLVAAAQAKADDMAEKGYFAHNSPDGTTSWQWFRDAGYSFAFAGENLAVDFTDSEDVVDAWMDSPTHRANIMDGRFTEIGIATAVGTYKGQKAIFVVQMFGTPAKVASAAPVEIRMEAEENIELESVEVLGAAASEVEKEPAPIAAMAEVPGAEPIAPAVVEQAPATPAWAFLAASPEALLRTLYIISGALLLLALMLVTRLEWRRHHIPQALAASMMLVVISGLFLAADRFVFTEPTIGQADAEERA